MKIAIVGTGYVGLVTGISLSTLGHQVICIDNNLDKVKMIKKGLSPFYEPNINIYLKKVTRAKRFNVTENLEDAIISSDITIIAVGTPTINGKIDLSLIKKSATQIGTALRKIKKYHIVVVKSTVLPGVTENLVKPILEENSLKKVGEFGLCMNPEFLREGSALEDALKPDRIIIGQIDSRSGKGFAKVYNKISTPKIFTNLWTAEMIKYAANALLATMISYSNEIARISESTGQIDVIDVWKGVHLDKRLNPLNGKARVKPGILNYIFSGIGFGGSCLPKDTKALVSFANELGIEAQLIKSVININQTQPQRVVLLLKKAISESLKNEASFSFRGKKIAILGLAFKPNTDDIRESASFAIIENLLTQGVKVYAHDPMAFKNGIPKKISDYDIVLSNSVQEAIKDANAVIIATAWDEYRKITPQFFKKHMKQPIVFDGRRIYDKQLFSNGGVIYKGIGL